MEMLLHFPEGYTFIRCVTMHQPCVICTKTKQRWRTHDDTEPCALQRRDTLVFLNITVRKCMSAYGLDSTGSREAPVVCCCEHGNEPSDFIKGGECFDKLSDCQLLKKDSAPWAWSCANPLVSFTSLPTNFRMFGLSLDLLSAFSCWSTQEHLNFFLPWNVLLFHFCFYTGPFHEQNSLRTQPKRYFLSA
jgi:hypothetical protein